MVAGVRTSPRLHFLDGLRGFASLYVLLFHAATVTLEDTSGLSPATSALRAWLGEGRLAVVFFIVLSGFSLTLPIARADSPVLLGGFASFLWRRARRIFPPYYAALLASILMIVGYNLLAPRLGLGKPIDPAALELGSVLSHLVLVHNLSFDWAYRINGPMWSVATEWQIYLIFPLLLLPLRRYAGNVVAFSVAWLVGAAPFYLLPSNANFFWACPWFLGSFALGMFGADIAFAPKYQGSWLRERAPWGALTVACFLVLVALFWSGASRSLSYPELDFLVSLLAFAWINAGARDARLRPSQPSPVFAFLGSRAAVELGAFSYSVYLVQHPLLRLTEKLCGRLHLGPDFTVWLHLLIGVPFVLALAWVFAEFFERPFTSGGVLLPALRRRFGVASAGASPGP